MRVYCKQIMADESDFFGCWKIVECVSLAGSTEPTGIEGTVFTLDEVGDVVWKVSENAEHMPFFSCETYEVNLSGREVLKFLGSFAVEFQVEISDDLMLLTYDQCCILQCQRVLNHRPPNEVPFSFLPCLEEGYFSDGIIRAENGREFKVHKTILSLAIPELDWNADPMPLSGLREDVVYMMLYYIYSECLVKGLSEETACAGYKAAKGIKGLEKFSELCQTFLKNTALKQQIVSLVTDIHACADRMIDLLNGKGTAESGSGSFSEPGLDRLVLSPARLCYIIKQALREGAIAGAKLVILCDLFSRRKGDLSREERHEIIKYAKSRLPVFMNQLHRFFEVCKSHSANMTVQQRHEIAAYLVPEIETTLDTMSTFVVEMKTSLEDIISQSSFSEKSSDKGHVKDVLGKALRNALHTRELIKLKRFHERMTKSFHNLMLKKEKFCLMTQEEKVRSVSKNLEHLMDEVPLFLVRIEDVMSALDEKVSWREWKYLFKLGTSKVSWVLSKIQKHTETVSPIFQKACEMVQRDQFTESISAIGLVSKPAEAGTASACTSHKAALSAPKYAQLSSVESLCIPPYAQDSTLANKALQLLQQPSDAKDVIFEVITTSETEDVFMNPAGEESRQDVEKHITEIPAHRVIIASRCDWFRRALLSGMRESIDKKIPVHGTSPELFSMLLKYLYSGQLDTQTLSTDQLADLLSLSDGYEMDSLKCHCEYALNYSIDEETALFLFGLADQYNARVLKERCLHYISLHVHLLYSDVFTELSETLQKELQEKCDISWPRNQGSSIEGTACRHKGPPGSASSCSEMDEVMKALELSEVQSPQSTDSTSSSFLDDLRYVEDSENVEICVAELRAILGDEVPHDVLLRVALAADYQVNRALNYYFSS